MISAATMKFLRDLANHNEREWFQDNKSRYELARLEFEIFVEAVLHGIAAFDPAVAGLPAKKCIFRIHRDTRFSKDKSPYKTHFGAHIGAFASQIHDRAGYYIHLEPKGSMLGGGAYLPPAKWLAAIRDSIDRDASGLRKILNGAGFKKHFGSIEGEALKTAPKGFSADHPDIDLLKQKSFLAIYKASDAEVTDAKFVGNAVKVFKALKPFDDYLNGVLITN